MVALWIPVAWLFTFFVLLGVPWIDRVRAGGRGVQAGGRFYVGRMGGSSRRYGGEMRLVRKLMLEVVFANIFRTL